MNQSNIEVIYPKPLVEDIESCGESLKSSLKDHSWNFHFWHFIDLLDGPQEYRNFCFQYKSLRTLALIFYVIIGIFIPLSCMAMISSDYDSKFVFCFTMYLIITAMITTAVLASYSQEVLMIKLRLVFEDGVDGYYVLAVSAINGLYLLFRVMDGECKKTSSFQDYWHCNPYPLDALPEVHTIFTMIIPIVSVVLFRTARWSIHLSAWLVTLVFLYLSTCFLPVEFSRSWLANIAFTFFGGVIFYEVRRQSFHTYNLQILLEASAHEIASLKESEYADEMRHLIGNVAHDLKTPLTAFVAGVEQIQTIALEISSALSDVEVKSDGHHSCTSCISEAKMHLLELFKIVSEVADTNQFMIMTINRCIDHSKVTNNVALLASNTSFNLVETVAFPVDCVRRMQNSVDIVVSIEPSLRGTFIISDKLWFSENIFCLLSNAVRYSEGGMAELRISKVDPIHPSRIVLHQAMHFQLPADDLDSYLLVELVDSGKGVASDKLPTLFAPFKQAQRRAGGTGLGLFAMACRMRALGGYYGVRHREDSPGSIFWFAIPYKEDDMLSAPQEDGHLHEAHDTCHGPEHCHNAVISLLEPPPECPLAVNLSLSILLVDDTLPIQKVLSGILRRRGHHVDIADNGLKAVRMLGMSLSRNSSKNQFHGDHDKNVSTQSEPHSYDVVLMDLQMPVMDGFEAIAHIRRHEDAHHLSRQCIIAMSANSDDLTVNESLKAGADYFMMKPFQLDTFNSLLSEYKRRQKSIMLLGS